jgi:hypothetical protein
VAFQVVEPVEDPFILYYWPGVNAPDLARTGRFSGNLTESTQYLQNVSFTSYSKFLDGTADRALYRWKEPFAHSNCVESSEGRTCQISIQYTRRIFDPSHIGRQLYTVVTSISTTDMNEPLRLYSTIENSIAYMMDLNSGFMMACSKDIVVSKKGTVPLGIKPSQMKNEWVQIADKQIRAFYGNTYEKVKVCIVKWSNYINL